ncbi:serine hydrolase domain-containing protein [Sphingomicrobium clamense]|uniref:Beta-lactamase family protein n=1 Tax=Sphingomicrobium clamense TaxID=2851013 RepID=A0ABS6V3M8_9SPHN|nr:serine hydrolase domain-containing protein [Sphingomicrobium sp. B8]MBW0143693.1 beta-lactamase family protein [Sphingomicrobium sp. B8]
MNITILAALAMTTDIETRLTAGRDAALQCESAIAIAMITPEGRAQLSNGKAISAATPLRTASATKTVTAAAALRLVEQGRLDLDAPIADRLDPALTDILEGDGYDPGAMTLRQLLSHSAGLYSHAEDPRYAPAVFADPDHRWTVHEQVALMADYGDPVGAPGEKFEYSDTGYVLVGNMIERATRLPLAAAVRDLLDLDDLRLRESWWDVFEADRARRGRQHVGGEDVTDVHGSADAFGGGGLVMSMRDLATLFRAINEGRLFENAETLEAMRWQGEHENADRYRLGLFANTNPDGNTSWSHSGFWGVLALHQPHTGLTIAGATDEQSDFRCLVGAMRAASHATTD